MTPVFYLDMSLLLIEGGELLVTATVLQSDVVSVQVVPKGLYLFPREYLPAVLAFYR